MPEPPDEALIEAIRGGDPRAFETLYDRYQDWVVSLALRFSGNREDALDVLQETFTYFFRKFPGFRLTSKLKTFLYPVIKHLAVRKRELSRRRVTLEGDREAPARPEGSAEPLLARLPEAQQEVVRLRFVDGLDLQEIAEALEVPLGTVKSRLHAALETLRGKLS